MIRALISVLLVAGVASLAAFFADNSGALSIDWLGWRVETSLGLALAGIAIVFGLLFAIFRGLAWLRTAPARAAQRRAEAKRARGLSALTRGLVAAAVGDAGEARRYGRQAERLLEDRTLANLLGAQTAQLSGDDAAARVYYEALLESDETELLGLRGLLSLARRQGDRNAAIAYANRARLLQPRSEWAFDALIDSQTAAGEWDEALNSIETARKSGHISSLASKRWRAALLTAKAYQADQTGDGDLAESLALQAHNLMPSFAPAATLAARKLHASGRDWKAAGIIEEAWREAPHPSLIEAYIALSPGETAHDRAKRLNGLAEMRPDHMESRLLRARQAINTRSWADARTALEEPARVTPTARVCALMAEIERGERRHEGAAREWLARAVVAPPEPDWIRTSFDLTTEEWAALAREVALAEQWPPELDVALFAKGQPILGSFAEELRTTPDSDDLSEPDKQAPRGKSVYIV